MNYVFHRKKYEESYRRQFLRNYVTIAFKNFKIALQLIAISFFFKVDPTTGSITTTDQNLDYETKTSHSMQVFAKSGQNGKQFVCLVQVLVQSQDEYPPVFNQDVYTFDVPNNANSGHFLGQIRASDADEGPDGYLTYSIVPLNAYFDIDHRTGALTIRRQLDTGVIR